MKNREKKENLKFCIIFISKLVQGFILGMSKSNPIWSEPDPTRPDPKWPENKWVGYGSKKFDLSRVGSGIGRPDSTRLCSFEAILWFKIN
jgi:hypothetical protein